MNKAGLLSELISFNDEASECKVVIDGRRVVPKYKSKSTLDTKNIDNAFSELGFRQIKVRKYTDEKFVWYTLGTEKMQLEDLIDDISYRFEYYSPQKKAVCCAQKIYGNRNSLVSKHNSCYSL